MSGPRRKIQFYEEQDDEIEIIDMRPSTSSANTGKVSEEKRTEEPTTSSNTNIVSSIFSKITSAVTSIKASIFSDTNNPVTPETASPGWLHRYFSPKTPEIPVLKCQSFSYAIIDVPLFKSLVEEHGRGEKCCTIPRMKAVKKIGQSSGIHPCIRLSTNIHDLKYDKNTTALLVIEQFSGKDAAMKSVVSEHILLTSLRHLFPGISDDNKPGQGTVSDEMLHHEDFNITSPMVSETMVALYKAFTSSSNIYMMDSCICVDCKENFTSDQWHEWQQNILCGKCYRFLRDKGYRRPIDTIHGLNRKSVFKLDDVHHLRDFFKNNQYPTRAEKEALSTELKIPYKNIDQWFKDTRYRQSRKK